MLWACLEVTEISQMFQPHWQLAQLTTETSACHTTMGGDQSILEAFLYLFNIRYSESLQKKPNKQNIIK